MTRRTRDLTPGPMASPAAAAHWTIEHVRTQAGTTLWEAGQSLEEIRQRVKVRIKHIRLDPYDPETGDATGIIWTQLDNGPWRNEGRSVLSRRLSGA